LPAARQAIASYHDSGDAALEHVIIANGCSGALELALTALLDVNDVLLVPQPAFPLYQVICESHGAQVAHYRLRESEQWQVDLEHVQELVQAYGNRIRGIVVNNPSNPTGAVFSKEHLVEIVRVCEQNCLVVVADEIYGDLVFGKHCFYPIAEIAASLGRTVPVITASGIGKQYLLPGWRVGWVVFQDK
jgi:tyrosine aminotransferase